MSSDVRWEGLDQVIAQYGRVASSVAGEMEDAIDAALAPVIKALAQYPPPRPGQRYIRTGKTRQGWITSDRRFRVGRGGVSVSVRNPVPYNRYVQGVDQARVHQGRWLRVADAQDQLVRVYGPLELTRAAARISQALP